MFDLTKTAFRFGTLSFLLTLTACEQQFQVKEILSSLSIPGAGASAVPEVTPTPISTAPPSAPNSDICFMNPTAPACIKTPVVTTPGVVTILFTMSQIPQGSATLLLVNAIKYASPSHSPKILFLKDSATYGEDEGDPKYIKDTLLLGYDVTYGVIPAGGLDPSALVGKDLIMVSNPGYPLADRKTFDTLSSYSGGVILLGDDMAAGSSFNVETLTGLKFKNSGTSMTCNGHTYGYDNLSGYSYQIAINPDFLPGIPAEYQHYQYGNDLDQTEANPGTEVLAWASAAAGTCDIGKVPAVVRHAR